MTRYIEAFVVPVRESHLETYKTFSERLGKIWLEHGALGYVEYVATDLHPSRLHPGGLSGMTFPEALRLTDEETVVFAWVTFSSREDRFRVTGAVLRDPRMAGISPVAMGFDAKRTIFGGFTELVNL